MVLFTWVTKRRGDDAPLHGSQPIMMTSSRQPDGMTCCPDCIGGATEPGFVRGCHSGSSSLLSMATTASWPGLQIGCHDQGLPEAGRWPGQECPQQCLFYQPSETHSSKFCNESQMAQLARRMVASTGCSSIGEQTVDGVVSKLATLKGEVNVLDGPTWKLCNIVRYWSSLVVFRMAKKIAVSPLFTTVIAIPELVPVIYQCLCR